MAKMATIQFSWCGLSVARGDWAGWFARDRVAISLTIRYWTKDSVLLSRHILAGLLPWRLGLKLFEFTVYLNTPFHRSCLNIPSRPNNTRNDRLFWGRYWRIDASRTTDADEGACDWMTGDL